MVRRYAAVGIGRATAVAGRQFLLASLQRPIKGVYSTYYYMHGNKIPIKDRIQDVVNWLNLPAAQRPHLITFYLPWADDAGHTYGPIHSR
jgi:predicted AlkP superfamily pyrophosphatase or phosphodiesterase